MRRILGASPGEPFPAARVEAIKMGTTVATNALLERQGERTALLITRGFADALRIGYQNRPRLFVRRIDLSGMLYERVLEVDERIGARGDVVRPLDVNAARRDLERLHRDGIAALQEGKVLIVYPEGTISRDPRHWPMHPHTGVARLALGSDAPVIPMVHWGTHDVLDGYHKRYRPLPRTTVTVRCGAPVDLTPYKDRTVDAALLREVTDLIMGRVRDLLAEVRAEAAPAAFYRWSGA